MCPILSGFFHGDTDTGNVTPVGGIILLKKDKDKDKPKQMKALMDSLKMDLLNIV